MPKGILSGLRVIDCGTYVAGPASTTIMSDFEAEVVKIERPQGGDLYRCMVALPGFAQAEINWPWVLTSRNKKSVALDLSSSQGRAVLIRLVKTADVADTSNNGKEGVVVENLKAAKSIRGNRHQLFAISGLPNVRMGVVHLTSTTSRWAVPTSRREGAKGKGQRATMTSTGMMHVKVNCNDDEWSRECDECLGFTVM